MSKIFIGGRGQKLCSEVYTNTDNLVSVSPKPIMRFRLAHYLPQEHAIIQFVTVIRTTPHEKHQHDRRGAWYVA